jgi:hypothetical protein
MVTTGGGLDQTEANLAGAEIAETLASRLTSAAVTLAPRLAGSDDLPRCVSALSAPEGLAPHLNDYDMVVTAGGVTLLESLCLGRPTVAVVVADNQRRAVEGAASAGACLAATVDEAVGQALRLASDFSLRRGLSDSARKLVDGRGACRVARSVAQLGEAK